MKRGWYVLVGELMSAIIPVLAKGLTEENIEKCAEFLITSGQKIGDKFLAYLEKRKTSNENEGNNEIPSEVQQEVRASLKEALKNAEKPVYMDGIAFFFEVSMDEEAQGLLEEILTNIDYETEDIVWEDEEKAKYQKIVDDFIEKNYGCAPDINENDYLIEEDSFYLNFGFSRPEDYYRIINDLEIRSFADALNQLLEDKYIVTYTTY